MKMTPKVTDLLKKELSYAQFALQKLDEESKWYEKEYDMTGKKFLKDFEAGKLGDDRAWFEWYGLALSIKDWNETQKEIAQTIRTS